MPTTPTEREAFLREHLTDRPVEADRITVHVPRLEPEEFRRHTNYDGTPGGWVHVSAEVASGVIVPGTTIVDAHATIRGQGRLDNSAYYGMRSWVDFTHDLARGVSA
jgi:hypothetical protein